MKNNQTIIIRSICIVIVLFFTVLSASAATKMPVFELKSVSDGQTVHSSQFDGKVILLTFFATWCPPCVEEVPALKKLHNDLSENGFSVVGLSVDQHGPTTVARFVEKQEINYPILMAESKTTRDFGGVYGIPVAFLVNRSGNVVKKYTGYIQHTVLEKDVRSLLN